MVLYSNYCYLTEKGDMKINEFSNKTVEKLVY